MRAIQIALSLVAIAAVTAVGATAGAAAAPRAAQERDIVDTAVAAGKFKTLAKLLMRAGLVDALKQPGPYTVFAPTDRAFRRLPDEQLAALKRNKRRLKAVLLYHVAPGRLLAEDVVRRSSVKTLNGQRVRISLRESNVFLNRARVITPDVMASNGVIHVINRVLSPPAR